MQTRHMVLYYDNNDNNPLGSEYTLFMELKTIWGIQRRISDHNIRMKNRGMKYYKIITYYNWKNGNYAGYKYYL